MGGLVACSADEEFPVSDSRDETAVLPDLHTLVLKFRFDADTQTRAADPDVPKVPGTELENKLKKLDILILTHPQEGIKTEHIVVENPIFLDNEKVITVKTKSNLKEAMVYVAANLSERQYRAFHDQIIGGTLPHYTIQLPDASQGCRLAADLSPLYTAGVEEWNRAPQISRQSVAMTCTEGAKPSVSTETPEMYTAGFDMKRLVAKILVTCSAKDTKEEGDIEGVAYVPLKKRKGQKELKGWIRRESVHFMINGQNRKTYMMQKLNEHTDTDANVLDPNDDLKAFTLNPASYYGDFFYLPLSQHFGNGMDYWSVLPYDAARLPNGQTRATENTYWEGIYCPENTFAPVETLPEALAASGTSIPPVTHVCIAAKFTPKELYMEHKLFDQVAKRTDITEEVKQQIAALKAETEQNQPGKDVVLVTCPNESVCHALLTASLREHQVDYPTMTEGFYEQTFFYYDKDESQTGAYTYGAARLRLGADNQKAVPDMELGNYVPHLGGFGFYYTYIDNRHPDNKADNFIFYRHGQVERNRYYLLNIQSITHPGSSITNPNYIEVHTWSLPWKFGGSGEIELN